MEPEYRRTVGLYLALAIVVAATIYVVGSVPSDDFPPQPFVWDLSGDAWLRFDKAEHAIAFGFFAAFATVAATFAGGAVTRYRIPLVLGATAVLAFALEWHQVGISGHKGSIVDAVAGLAGAVFAVAATHMTLAGLLDADDGAAVV